MSFLWVKKLIKKVVERWFFGFILFPIKSDQSNLFYTTHGRYEIHYINFLVRIENRHFFSAMAPPCWLGCSSCWLLHLEKDPFAISAHGASYCNVALQKPICNTHLSEALVKGDVFVSQHITFPMLDYFVDKILRVFICTSDLERIWATFWFAWILEERKRIDKIPTKGNGGKQEVNYKSINKEQMKGLINW